MAYTGIGTTTTNHCSIIGGCETDERIKPGHIRECGCHRYGWALCQIGESLMRGLRDAEDRHGWHSRQRADAYKAYHAHNDPRI